MAQSEAAVRRREVVPQWSRAGGRRWIEQRAPLVLDAGRQTLAAFGLSEPTSFS
jgi:hypothetical protein